MNNSTLRKAIFPIILILTITVVACYMIIEQYNKERHAKVQAQNQQQMENISDAGDEEEETVSISNLEYQVTGILTAKDIENKTVTLKPVENGKDVLLEYDGTTSFYGRHGNSMSAEQLQLGDIFEASYSVHNGRLKSLTVSDKAWTMTDISKFTINEKRKQMIIGDDTFKIDGDLVVSYGQELAKLMDVTEMDTLIVKGVDRKVYSIIVNRGHGYLRIKNDAYFVGGWLEIGSDIIKPVTSEMLVPVPEGDYHIRVTHRGYAAQEDISIEKDKEAILDLDDVEIEEVAVGHVRFEIEPDFAQLYIDNEITDFVDRVPLEYGVHKVRVEMAGYDTVETNIKILSEYADVDISLEKSADSSSSSTTSSSSSMSSSLDYPSNTGSSQASEVVISEEKQLYIEAPVGAEVYLDGNYVGIAPAHTTKVTGQHVLTLSKTGYATKSYTINIDNDDRDVTFSFSDLIAE